MARRSGAEIGLARFVEAARDDVEATAVLAEDGPLADDLRAAGARVEVLPLSPVARDVRRAEIGRGRRQAAATATTAAYAARLARRLAVVRPQLVHSISLKSGVYGALAARAAGVPFVWHLHDNLTADYLSARLAGVMRRVVTTLPDGLLAPSAHTLATVGPRAARLPTSTIAFPVPLPAEAAEVRPELRVVGMVGRLTPWKGQDVFLRGFAQAFAGTDVRARVIGSAMFGEEAFERGLHALARRLGIAGQTDFVGFRADMEAELRVLDLLVHASVLPDPMTGVVLEGLAAGVPTVSADDGGHAELVRRHDAGLLFRPGDAGSLAAALRRAAAEDGLRRELAARGRVAAGELAPAVVLARVLDFYDEVLARRAARLSRPRARAAAARR